MRTLVRAISTVTATLTLLGLLAMLGGCHASGGAGSSSAPTAAPTTNQPTAIPSGYAEVTSSSARITIALPADWRDISSYSSTELIPLAEDLGTDDNKLLKERLDAYEVFKTASSSPGRPFSPRVYIDNDRHDNVKMDVGDIFSDAARQDLVTIETVEAIQTVNGQGIKGVFTHAQRGSANQGSVLYLPTSTADYARVFVFASSPDDAQQLTDVIIASVH